VNVENRSGGGENSEERRNTVEHERTAMRHTWCKKRGEGEKWNSADEKRPARRGPGNVRGGNTVQEERTRRREPRQKRRMARTEERSGGEN